MALRQFGTAAAVAVTLAVVASPASAAIEIQWWHAMTGANNDVVNRLAEEFNASQPDYKVVPSFKGSYPDTMNAGIAAFRAGNAPHIMQVFEVGTATMMGATGAIKPVYQLMKDAGEPFDPKAYLPTITGYYSTSKGDMLSFPFNSSSMVMWINKDELKKAGIADTAVRDNLALVCGDTGAAHALVMFAHALENAKPGELILVVAFGQGCDALLFRAADKIASVKPARGVSGYLARKREETNYQKFLAFNDTIEMERGMRSELDKATALSSLYRNRATITGFVGGKCNVCGTLQFPKTNICVNPNCNAFHSQEPQPFSDLEGRIMSYTADNLTYSADPPACYGMVQFDAGGRVMIDFTDVTPDDIDVGKKMDMVFRIKDYDGQRGFTRYFWKATPAGS